LNRKKQTPRFPSSSQRLRHFLPELGAWNPNDRLTLIEQYEQIKNNPVPRM
jgi:hypothetical protein